MIARQSRDKEWTDSDGFFVSAVCQLLNVELHIVDTSVPTVQIINQSDNDNRLKFSMGLIKNNYESGGHFQFIFQHEDGELPTFDQNRDWFQLTLNKGMHFILEYYLIYILYIFRTPFSITITCQNS